MKCLIYKFMTGSRMSWKISYCWYAECFLFEYTKPITNEIKSRSSLSNHNPITDQTFNQLWNLVIPIFIRCISMVTEYIFSRWISISIVGWYILSCAHIGILQTCLYWGFSGFKNPFLICLLFLIYKKTCNSEILTRRS